MWDAIVIGSGISGLTAGAALASRGGKVLLLEQHAVIGGLTQSFRRDRWTFGTGVHYVSGAGPGPDGQFRRLMEALGDGTLRFAPSANPYDIVRLPGFEFGIPHPEAAYRQALKLRFPSQHAAIDRWFTEVAEARGAAFALMASRGMPAWMAWAVRLFKGAAMHRYNARTVADALAGIDDARLRAVLGARGGDYGGIPSTAPLLEHALITGAYDSGSWYPVGGPARFAQSLVPTIGRAGGEVRSSADVREILTRDGRAVGVAYRSDGQRHEAHAPHVISTMGVVNTLAGLGDAAPIEWRDEVRRLHPGVACIALYLGFEGDLAAAGASSANVWIHESEDIDRRWRAPADEDAPALFVSFPSLKDPSHAGPPTAEVLALCDAAVFEPWLNRSGDDRPEDYQALKQWIEERLLAQFQRHFPTLVPMLRFHESSTPITQARYVRTPDGSMYGLEMTTERLESPALNIRTPVPGLLLAGQDVSGAGIQASAISGLLAAAAIDPVLLGRMGG